jgi:hypothetical protein
VPALVFGIPGDSITAIVIGVLYMKGMNPGPTVFLEQPELIYAVFIAFFVANLALLPLGFMAIRMSRQILHVPPRVLMPVILMFCVVGSFAINNTVFGVTVDDQGRRRSPGLLFAADRGHAWRPVHPALAGAAGRRTAGAQARAGRMSPRPR